VISDKDRCQSCKGNKVTQEKKVLEVHVEKGMQHGQKIVFQGEADEAVSPYYTRVPNWQMSAFVQALNLHAQNT
jgi:DnaJ-class molecular chaperone